MSHLIDIFLEPTKVFTALKEKPSFLVPLLLMMVGMAALVLLYFTSVDSDWYTDYTLQASGKEMTASEIAQAKTMMPSASVMGYIGAVTTPITILVMTCIYALYFMLASKITGAAVGFKQGMALSAWSNMPMLLGVVIALVGVFTMTSQTPFESLMLTNVDPLLVQLPTDHAWSGFAKGFNLLTFWTVFLAAVGWRTWTKAGWGQSVVVAAFPAVLIFGIWALIAAF